MTDEVDSCGAREIEVAVALGIPKGDAFPADGDGIRLAEGSPQHRRAKLLRVRRTFRHTRIIAEAQRSAVSSRFSAKIMIL